MAETKLQITEYEVEDDDGSTRTVTQYRTTVPKSLAEALVDSEETTIEWSIHSGSALKAEFKDE